MITQGRMIAADKLNDRLTDPVFTNHRQKIDASSEPMQSQTRIDTAPPVE